MRPQHLRPKRRDHGKHETSPALPTPDDLALGTPNDRFNPSPRTGIALSLAGLAILSWWLMALAQGPEAYATFVKAANSPIGLIVLVGLTWSFFQHLLSGIRHLVTDTGAAFELGVNKSSAVLTIVGSLLLTVLLWAWFLGYVK